MLSAAFAMFVCGWRVVLCRAIELPFDRRDVHDVLVALGRAPHQRLQAGVQHERRDGVDELRLEQLDGRHLVEQQAPRVALAQVDLLQILVELPFGEEILRTEVVGQESHLRQLCGRRDSVVAGSISCRRTPSSPPSSLPTSPSGTDCSASSMCR